MNVLPTLNPVRALPSPLDGNLKVLIFDTCPDAESRQWLQNAYERLATEGGAAIESELRYFWEREVGDTDSNGFHPTRHTVRTVVAVVNEDFEVQGLALAHGTIDAELISSPEGIYAQLTFSWPVARGWGKGKGPFVLTQAENRCIEQYDTAGLPLFESLRGIVADATPLWQFGQGWDESAQPLRGRLSVNLMTRVFSPAAAAVASMIAQAPVTPQPAESTAEALELLGETDPLPPAVAGMAPVAAPRTVQLRAMV